MKKVALINEKGGSCKTTLVVNLGSYLALYRGMRVLLIDLDPQGQTGKALGYDVRGLYKTIHTLLVDEEAHPEEFIHHTRIQGLDVILSNKGLIDFPVMVADHRDRMTKLHKRIAPLRGYDYIIFDSPPSLGLITLNIMMATDEIIIPVSLTYFALDGCAEIMDTVEQVRANFGRSDLEVSHIVPTLYRNTRLARELLEKLRSNFEDRVARTVIGYNVKIDEAQSHGQTIWEYAPKSRGAEMLRSLAEEVVGNGSEYSRQRSVPAGQGGCSGGPSGRGPVQVPA